MLDLVTKEICLETEHDALGNIETDPGVPLSFSGYKRRVFSQSHLSPRIKDAYTNNSGSHEDTYMKTSDSILQSVSINIGCCFFTSYRWICTIITSRLGYYETTL